MRAGDNAVIVDAIDHHLDGLAHARGKKLGADPLLMPHETVVALGLNLLWYLPRKRVGRGAGNVLVFEAADAAELRFGKPGEKLGEILLGLAGEADDEGRANGKVGADF